MNQEQFGQFWLQLKKPLKVKWDKLTDEDISKLVSEDNAKLVSEDKDKIISEVGGKLITEE